MVTVTMPTREATCCLVVLTTLACLYGEVLAFSDGSKLAQGFSATRSVYCHRSTNKRQPLHFNAKCNGYCEPNRQGDLYYDLEVSASSYWLDIVTINITAKEDSGRSVTGFSIYAVDEADKVAGSFIEDDDHILVGSCGNLLTYNQETHGAFHKMADRNRKNITFQFQPDGFNHGEIKFVVWVVNNQSDIHYLESPPLTPSKNGTDALDLKSVLHGMVSDVDINLFEDSFEYRKKMGYRLDLEDPFSLFESDPGAVELVPLNTTDNRTSKKTTATTAATSSASTTAKLEITTAAVYVSTNHQDDMFSVNVGMNGANNVGMNGENNVGINAANNAGINGANSVGMNGANNAGINGANSLGMNGANNAGINGANSVGMSGANNAAKNNAQWGARDMALESNLVMGDVSGTPQGGWGDLPQQPMNPRFNVLI
ncbi:unnamed protein product [Lymnaea stagnalis]|uniref:Reelin domain-containing protein n=1 Tax=Lymnaea stagnalis TaxID=6523 RepID=A0AAV2HL94_LYMST